MKISKHYKALFFIISLSFYLSTQNVSASEHIDNVSNNIDDLNECANALISMFLVLKPIGAEANLEIPSPTIEFSGVVKGTLSFPVNEQMKEIEIEYEHRLDDKYADIHLLLQVKNLLKGVFGAMLPNLLSHVNKIKVLILNDIKDLLSLQPQQSLSNLDMLSEFLDLEETLYSPLANEITLVLPMSLFADAQTHLIRRMRHKLGHIMAYHRYGKIKIPFDQEWYGAVSKDDRRMSMYGNKSLTEDFC